MSRPNPRGFVEAQRHYAALALQQGEEAMLATWREESDAAPEARHDVVLMSAFAALADQREAAGERMEAARACEDLAACKRKWASQATSGGEGFARMADVDRTLERMIVLRGR